MTRKLRRNYSLSVVAPFIAILILLIAAAVLAQTSGAGQRSEKANAVLTPAEASALAQAERPLSPWAGGGGSPVSRSHTKRHGARPLDGNPLLLAPVVTYDSGGQDSTWLAVGDLNGDGHPDVAMTVCSYPCTGSSSVAVLLGNGDGTFQAPVLYSSGGWNPWFVAIADVNGDGKPDLVVVNFFQCENKCYGVGEVSVLLGNGDGTFQAPVSYSSGGTAAFSVAIADLNGDGKPDLVVANWGSFNGVLGVLLGNGDGTFQAPVAYSSGGYQSYSVAIGDVNGDGHPDLVATNQCQSASNCSSGSISVLLGNGDGTFQAPVSYNDGLPGTSSVAIGDVNGDGHLDLVAASDLLCTGCTDGGVSVLLGNGDGTFQPPVSYDSGGEKGFSVVIGDLNGDGHPDLVVTNANSNSVGVLLGNGDGTFQPAMIYATGGVQDYSVAVADVNGDGKLDVLVANAGSLPGDGVLGVLLNDGNFTTTKLASSLNPSGYGQSVTFTAAVSAASGTPTGTVIFYEGSTTLGSATLVNGSASISISSLSARSHSIIAAYQGSSSFSPSSSAPLIQVVNGTPTTTLLVSTVNPSVYGQSVTFTAAVSSASGTPTGTVVFYDHFTQLGSATLASGSASLSTSSLTAGAHSITAAYQGSGAFEPSTSAPLIQVANPATTTTSLASSVNPVRAKQTVTYTATVTSQYGGAATGTVTFKDGAWAVATVALSGNQASYSTSYRKAGLHSMTATYSGDASNTGSVSPVLVEQINKDFASKTALTTSGSPSYVGQPVTFTATVTSAHGAIPDGELVTFYDGNTVLGSVALTSEVAAYTTSALSKGKHKIEAAYPGDDVFEPSSRKIGQVVK